MKNALFYIFFLFNVFVHAQSKDTVLLHFNEYLGYVKKFHPIAKQAELTLAAGQANLLKSRGGFDPKIEVDYNTKQFKGTEYYDQLNAVFKVPTWYGVTLKGAYEQNEGFFLNPESTLPEDGLYSAGISLSIGQGLWINDRMATLKKAKYYKRQSIADRDLLVNEVLFNASLAYFNWLQAYNENKIFEDFFKNAETRFKAVKKSASIGQIAAIDTVEAKIAVQNRRLSLEQAKVKLMKKSLELSNFLWLKDNIPLELQSNVVPDQNLSADIDVALEISGTPLDDFTIENHPKIVSLQYKVKGLQVDKNLKANKLLPKVEVAYNFLTEQPTYINSLDVGQYKGGVSFQLPLFLRKERGNLKLAKYKLQDAELQLLNSEVKIKNKILSIYNELDSFEVQNTLMDQIVANYKTMLYGEERKFSFGESSLFILNSRENKLIDAKLKQNKVQNKYFVAKAKLFNSLSLNPKNL